MRFVRSNSRNDEIELFCSNEIFIWWLSKEQGNLCISVFCSKHSSSSKFKKYYWLLVLGKVISNLSCDSIQPSNFNAIYQIDSVKIFD